MLIATDFHLKGIEARAGCRVMLWRDGGRYTQKCSEGASRCEELAYPDCCITKSLPELGLERLVELSTLSNGNTRRKKQDWLIHSSSKPWRIYESEVVHVWYF